MAIVYRTQFQNKLTVVGRHGAPVPVSADALLKSQQRSTAGASSINRAPSKDTSGSSISSIQRQSSKVQQPSQASHGPQSLSQTQVQALSWQQLDPDRAVEQQQRYQMPAVTRQAGSPVRTPSPPVSHADRTGFDSLAPPTAMSDGVTSPHLLNVAATASSSGYHIGSSASASRRFSHSSQLATVPESDHHGDVDTYAPDGSSSHASKYMDQQHDHVDSPVRHATNAADYDSSGSGSGSVEPPQHQLIGHDGAGTAASQRQSSAAYSVQYHNRSKRSTPVDYRSASDYGAHPGSNGRAEHSQPSVFKVQSFQTPRGNRKPSAMELLRLASQDVDYHDHSSSVGGLRDQSHHQPALQTYRDYASAIPAVKAGGTISIVQSQLQVARSLFTDAEDNTTGHNANDSIWVDGAEDDGPAQEIDAGGYTGDSDPDQQQHIHQPATKAVKSVRYDSRISGKSGTQSAERHNRTLSSPHDQQQYYQDRANGVRNGTRGQRPQQQRSLTPQHDGRHAMELSGDQMYGDSLYDQMNAQSNHDSAPRKAPKHRLVHTSPMPTSSAYQQREEPPPPKPRRAPVDYKPYTLQDYLRLPKPELGSLQPNMEREDLVEKV